MKPTTWILIILGALLLLVLLISYGLYRYALVRPRPRKKPKPPTKKWAPLMTRIHAGEAYLDSIPGKSLHLVAEDGTLLCADYYPAADPHSKKRSSPFMAINRAAKQTSAYSRNFFGIWGILCSFRITAPMARARANSSDLDGLTGWIAFCGWAISASSWVQTVKSCSMAFPWVRLPCS